MEKFLRTTLIKTEASVKSGYYFEPMGIINVGVPFNFPLWLTLKSSIPIISSGNTVLHRTSDSTPMIG